MCIKIKCKHIKDDGTECGHKNSIFASFCGGCGAPLNHKHNVGLLLAIVCSLLVVGGGIWIFLVEGNDGGNNNNPIPQFEIIVKSDNPNWGTVTGGCQVDSLAIVTIKAEAKEGCQFVKWDDGNTDSVRKVIAVRDAEYVAQFDSIASETSLVHGDDVTIPKDEPKVEPKDEPKVEPKVEPKLKEKNYWFGRYEGNLKNGIPEGRGVMYYNCHVQIAKYQSSSPGLFAEDGDYFVGNWKNGDIYTGSLYNKDGVLKYENIRVKPRTRPYDLEKDEYIK